LDRDQHITQDAAEHYAVFRMAEYSEEQGWATEPSSERLRESFLGYLKERDWDFEGKFSLAYPAYRKNVDKQIPAFVQRLHDKFPSSSFSFLIDEANFRNQGLKADFSLQLNDRSKPFLISLKNYVGSGGITRPQVSSGTFLSFAAGFVFERVGVGSYSDPRHPEKTFSGSSREDRNEVLKFQGRNALISPLDVLEDLQQIVRKELLTVKFFDRTKVRKVIEQIVPKGQEAMLEVFEALGAEVVREKFLERVGLDGTEEILFFDEDRSVDSITNSKFHDLSFSLNSPETLFQITPVGQSLRFAFSEDKKPVLQVDVPLTINTNGAWHRPKEKYEGKQIKNDKGHELALEWGELRPYKSREIATSTNTYVNLKATGIFD
jgi:hypothetical protein